MKLLTLYLFLFLVVIDSKAQNFNLDSFYSTNTTWSEMRYYQAGQGQSGGNVYRLKILRDSNISNQKYWLLQREEVGNFSNNFWVNPPYSFFYNSYSNKGIVGGIRIDSQKVFFRKWSNMIEYVAYPFDVDTIIYDFGLQLGDTFGHLNYKVVTQKDSIQIQSGQWVERIVFESYPNTLINDYWLRGIGSNHGFLMSYKNAYPDQVSLFNFLKCFEKNAYFLKDLNGVFFNAPNSDSCLFISTKVEEPKFEDSLLQISPNPFHDFLLVHNTKKDENFKIINLLGQQCYSGKFQAEQTKIDLPFLPIGVYYLQTEKACLKLIKI